LAAALWAFLGVGFFGTGVPQVDDQLRVIAQILYATPLVVHALWRLRTAAEPFDVVFSVGIAAALVVAIASHDFVGSLETVALSAAFIMLFWAMRAAGRAVEVRRALAVGVVLALTAWLVAFALVWIVEDIDWISAGGGVPDLEPVTALIWISPNVVPILTLLGIPFLLELPAGPSRRILASLFVAASVVTVPLSNGRSGWLGLLFAGIAAEVVSGFALLSWLGRWLRKLRLSAGAVGAGALLVLVGIAIYRGPLLATNTLEARLFIWREALGIGSSSPLVGGGQSTFPWLRLTHAPDYAYRVPVYHAHNVIVQTLSDGGVILIAGLAAVILVYAVFVWRRRERLSRRSLISVAVLVGFAAASMLDDFSTNPGLTALAITIAAWLMVDLEPLEVTVRKPVAISRASMAIVLLAALVALPAVVVVDRARGAAAEGARDAEAADWPGAVAGYRQATALHEQDGGYHLALGFSLSKAGDANAALKEYRTAARIAPGDARAWGALAALSGNDPNGAIEFLDRAARLTVEDPQYSLRLANAEAKLGQVPAAVGSYARAATLNPNLLGALPQEVHISRAAILDSFSSVVDQLAGLERLDAASLRLDADLARGQLQADAPPAWQAIAAAQEGALARASTLAAAAVSHDPWRARSYLAAATVAWFQCDQAAFQHAMRLERMTVDHFEAAAWGELRPNFDPTYREIGLGDYQPILSMNSAALQPWPFPLLSTQPSCSWTPDFTSIH
jgi:O-antigen ligase/Tfp pilus assembly protein PilF